MIGTIRAGFLEPASARYFRFLALRFLAGVLRFFALRVPLVSSWLSTEAANCIMSRWVAFAPFMMREASLDNALLDCLAMVSPCRNQKTPEKY
jgi:hypothetical protein